MFRNGFEIPNLKMLYGVLCFRWIAQYKLITFIYFQVFPKRFPESVTKVVIWKRYNDFKKLHKELKVRFQKLHLEEKFPQFVKAKFFGR